MIRRIVSVFRYCSTIRNFRICNKNNIVCCGEMSKSSVSSSGSSNVDCIVQKIKYKITLNEKFLLEFGTNVNIINITITDIDNKSSIKIPIDYIDAIIQSLKFHYNYLKDD